MSFFHRSIAVLRPTCVIALSLVLTLALSSGPTPARADDKCGPGMCWMQMGDMWHCMPMAEPCPGTEPGGEKPRKGETTLSGHLNESFLYADTSTRSPDKTAALGAGMVMGEVTHFVSNHDKIGAKAMLSPDVFLMPKTGYPQPGQAFELKKDGTPFIDAQHPHPFLSELAVCYGRTLGEKSELEACYKPVGEAPGPTSFMHRDSARGNPQAPLSHHNFDATHITPGVLEGVLRLKGTTLELAAQSGAEPSPTDPGLHPHKLDSFSVAIEHCAENGFCAGGSFGDILATDHDVALTTEPLLSGSGSGSERELHYTGWISSKHDLAGGNLATMVGAGSVRTPSEQRSFTGYIAEGSFLKDGNNVFGRLDGSQRRSLTDLGISGSSDEMQWLHAQTLGYERLIGKSGDAHVYLGGSFTHTLMPEDFSSRYGGVHAYSGEAHIRLEWMRAWTLKKDGASRSPKSPERPDSVR